MSNAKELFINKEDMELVKMIARNVKARLPSYIFMEDVIQDGIVGLLCAYKKYDASKGASFKTYASIRIFGAIIDNLRRLSVRPKKITKLIREIEKATRLVESRNFKEATAKDVADEMDLPIEEFHENLLKTKRGEFIYFKDMSEKSEFMTTTSNTANSNPEKEAMQEELNIILNDMINSLKSRDKLIFSLYYKNKLNQKEIGNSLNISESRISQRIKSITKKLVCEFSLYSPKQAS